MTRADYDLNTEQLATINSLVGNIHLDQLKHVEFWLADDVGIFIPISGPCLYAITPLHTHPAFMITVAINSQQMVVIENREIIPQAGEMQIVSPLVPHHEVYQEMAARYIALFISPSLMRATGFQYPEYTDRINFSGPIFPCPPALRSYITAFILESEQCLPGASDILRALSIEIAHCVWRAVLGTGKPAQRLAQRLDIDHVIEYMQANLSSRLSLSSLAEQVSMSQSHFAKIFKVETGIPPLRYLNDLRLESARRMLQTGTSSITEIAYECGFGSPAYLSRRFSNKYGQSPSEYQAAFNGRKLAISKAYLPHTIIRK